jgi:hypothetical protein
MISAHHPPDETLIGTVLSQTYNGRQDEDAGT